MLQLASNENPLGMSEAARRAAADALAGASWYPDANGTLLKEALSARLGVPADWLTLGNGSSELLTLAALVNVEPGYAVLYSQYGFVVYGVAATHVHARHIVVPAREFGHDLAAMARAIDDDTRLIFIANPNNPTGTFIDGPRLLAFVRQVPAHVTVLIDEAYTEYLGPQQRYDSIEWVGHLPNLIVARTFSKAYGLAGLRVGYAVSQPAMAGRLNAARPRFNVSTPAIAAATAALADQDFVRRSHEMNAAGHEQLATGLSLLGLDCLRSAGNFVMVRVGDATAFHQRLASEGIAVSTLHNYALDEWLRISVGLPEQNRHVLGAMARIVSDRHPVVAA